MKGLLRAILRLLVNSFFARLVFLAFTIWLAREVSANDYSTVIFLYSAFMFFSWLGGGPLFLSAVRRFRDFPEKRRESETLYLNSGRFTGRLVALLFLCYTSYILWTGNEKIDASEFFQDYLFPVICCSLGIPFIISSRIHIAKFQVSDRYFLSGFLQFSARVLSIVLIFSAVYSILHLPAIVSFAVALLGSSIFIFLVTSRENVNSPVTSAAVDHQVRVDYRKEVMPYLIAGGGVQVFQQSLIVLATFFFVDIGLAGVLTCLTLASQGFMLLQSGVTVVFSKLQSNNESANRTILSGYYKLATISATLALFALYISSSGILGLFDEAFSKYGYGLFLLCASWILYFLKGPVTSILALRGHAELEGVIYFTVTFFLGLSFLVWETNPDDFLVRTALAIQVISILEVVSFLYLRVRYGKRLTSS